MRGVVGMISSGARASHSRVYANPRRLRHAHRQVPALRVRSGDVGWPTDPRRGDTLSDTLTGGQRRKARRGRTATRDIPKEMAWADTGGHPPVVLLSAGCWFDSSAAHQYFFEQFGYQCCSFRDPDTLHSSQTRWSRISSDERHTRERRRSGVISRRSQPRCRVTRTQRAIVALTQRRDVAQFDGCSRCGTSMAARVVPPLRCDPLRHERSTLTSPALPTSCSPQTMDSFGAGDACKAQGVELSRSWPPSAASSFVSAPSV